MSEIRDLVLVERKQLDLPDQNENQMALIHQIESAQLKITDTTNLGNGFLRSIGEFPAGPILAGDDLKFRSQNVVPGRI